MHASPDSRNPNALEIQGAGSSRIHAGPSRTRLQLHAMFVMKNAKLLATQCTCNVNTVFSLTLFIREIMKFSSVLVSHITFVVISLNPAFAASSLSATDIVRRQLQLASSCLNNETGKITKVDVISGKEVARITQGKMKVDASKRFLVIYAQRGKIKDFFIWQEAVAADVTAPDLSAKLVGKAECVMDPQD